MNILITGAQLANKGAESMLYVTVDEMKKRFPEAEIYFATNENYDETKYIFKKFYMSGRALDITIGGSRVFGSLIKGVSKDIIKFCVGRKTNLDHFYDIKENFESMDIMIDVSGFNLGKQWPKETHKIYLDRIELAKRYNIPVYLMPQSFGPFNYDSKMICVKERIAELLTYPRYIFAREREGYEDLIKTFELKNVVLSTDLVLQNSGVDWHNVFLNNPVIDVPRVVSKKSNENKIVGIVPNEQCFRHGNKTWNLKIYKAIIDQLLVEKYKIIIFRHSRGDIGIGQMIKDIFEENGDVYLETKEFSCLEYNEYVKQFSFIICSRYHGIVHAYKNGIPAIALGWAIKYQALADCVGQGQYAFDITEGNSDVHCIVDALKDMIENTDENRKVIKDKVIEKQKMNCFDVVQKDIERVMNN